MASGTYFIDLGTWTVRVGLTRKMRTGKLRAHLACRDLPGALWAHRSFAPHADEAFVHDWSCLHTGRSGPLLQLLSTTRKSALNLFQWSSKTRASGGELLLFEERASAFEASLQQIRPQASRVQDICARLEHVTARAALALDLFAYQAWSWAPMFGSRSCCEAERLLLGARMAAQSGRQVCIYLHHSPDRLHLDIEAGTMYAPSGQDPLETLKRPAKAE